MSNDENPEAVRDRIAAELAALGEDPLTDEELSLSLSSSSEGDAPKRDLDVSTVELLVGLSSPEAYDAELSELSQRRVWAAVDETAGRSASEASAPTSPAELVSAEAPRRLWPAALVAVAVAAGVLLVPVLRAEPSAPPSPAAPLDGELQAMGEAARLGLEALPGASGTAQADAVVAAYAQRLEAKQERGQG